MSIMDFTNENYNGTGNIYYSIAITSSCQILTETASLFTFFYFTEEASDIQNQGETLLSISALLKWERQLVEGDVAGRRAPNWEPENYKTSN